MPGIKIEVVKNDYGYSYIFNLKNPDGTAADLSGMTAKIRARHIDFPETTLEKSIEITDDEAGRCEYTVAADDFAKEGLYYAEVETTSGDESGDGATISYQGFSIVVIPKV